MLCFASPGALSATSHAVKCLKPFQGSCFPFSGSFCARIRWSTCCLAAASNRQERYEKKHSDVEISTSKHHPPAGRLTRLQHLQPELALDPEASKSEKDLCEYLSASISSKDIKNVAWTLRELQKLLRKRRKAAENSDENDLRERLDDCRQDWTLDFGLWKSAFFACLHHSGNNFSPATEALEIGEEVFPLLLRKHNIHGRMLSSLANACEWVRIVGLFDKLWSMYHNLRGSFPNEQLVVRIANLAVNSGRVDVARTLFEQMRASEVALSAFSYSVLLKGYGRARNIGAVRQILREMLRSHVQFDKVCFNSAVDALVRCGEIVDARALVYNMKYRELRDIRTFNILLRWFAKNGRTDAAFGVRDEIFAAGLSPSQVTQNILIDACVHAKDFDSAMKLAECISTDEDSLSGSQSGTIEEAPKAPMKSSRRHRQEQTDNVNQLTIALSRILSGLAEAGRLRQAIRLLEEMDQRGAPPNYITYCSLINACMRRNMVSAAQAVFDSMKQKTNIALTVQVYNSMILGLCRSENETNVDSAVNVLRQMRQTTRLQREQLSMSNDDQRSRRDNQAGVACAGRLKNAILPSEVTYNAVIDGLVQFNRVDEAEEVVDWMRQDGVMPTVVTYTTLMKGWTSERQFDDVHRAFQTMATDGVKADLQALNSYMSACVRLSRLQSAQDVLNQLETDQGDLNLTPDVYSYTPFIAHEVRLGNLERAWQYYTRGKEHGVRINSYLAELMLNAISTLGAGMVARSKASRSKVVNMAVALLNDVWVDTRDKQAARIYRRKLLAIFARYPESRDIVAKAGGSSALRSASEKIFERHGWNEISSRWRMF